MTTPRGATPSPSGTGADSRADQLVALTALALASVALFWLLLFGSFRDVVLRFVHDDAFYYFAIARNWVAGAPSTFDGLTHTNGFHPLWQGLMLPLAAISRGCEEMARLAAQAGVGLLALAAVFLRQRLQREGQSLSWFPVAWCTATLLPATIYGLETPLAVATLGALLLLLPRCAADLTPVRGFLCGVAAAALVLARLDSLFWLAGGAVAFVLAVRANPSLVQPATRFAFLAALPVVVCTGAYFALNLKSYGHALPISAMVKAARAGWFSFGIKPSLLMLLSLGGGVIALLVARAARETLADAAPARDRDPWLLFAPLGIALGLLAQLAVLIARGGRESYNWYFALPVYGIGYLVPWLAVLAPGIAQRATRRTILWIACIALLAAGVRGKVAKESSFAGAYDAAMHLRAHPQNVFTFAAPDCGILGALSEQRFINIDGLTAGFEFQEALATGKLAAYLQNLGVNAQLVPPTGAAPEHWMLYAPRGIAGRDAVVDLFLLPPIEDLQHAPGEGPARAMTPLRSGGPPAVRIAPIARMRDVAR